MVVGNPTTTMDEQRNSALIIAFGIMIAALLHALLTKDVGRYQAIPGPDGDIYTLDTATGEVRDGSRSFYGNT